ncbi:putative MPP superfamily phosphohydrolase [Nitrospina gracilis Nb-211]|nr:putative MPP superfamily phosphohydrolase [Nitrospina gracilis Nb-211]
MKFHFDIFTKPIPRRSFLKGMLGVFAVSGAGVGQGYAGTWSSNIRLERVKITIQNLPPAFRGFTIGLLSDLHSSPIVSKGHLQSAAELLMTAKPDMIALTGDFIGHTFHFPGEPPHGFEPEYIMNIVEAFSGLEAPHGIYGVLGNHDYWSGPEAMEMLEREFERGFGVQWLRNRNTRLERGGASIMLAGVDDYWQTTCSPGEALKDIPEEMVRILLSHNPEVNEILYPSHRVDLILSGHTHGGQIKLPFIGAPFQAGVRKRKYMEGLAWDGERQTYVTRGVGHLVVPIRLLCPPEVSLITLV